MKTIIIGIAGGTGSGKTTITKLLRQRFGEAVSVVAVVPSFTSSGCTAK